MFPTSSTYGLSGVNYPIRSNDMKNDNTLTCDLGNGRGFKSDGAEGVENFNTTCHFARLREQENGIHGTPIENSFLQNLWGDIREAF